MTNERWKAICHGSPIGWHPVAGACLAALGCTVPAWGMQIETDIPDLKLTWDTTVKYSNAFRVKERSSALVANPQFDDGDRNFGTGLISNRFDILTEFDLRYQRFGARLSGAAWYDSVYTRHNDNDSAGLFGPGTSSANQSASTSSYDVFTPATRELMGHKAEVLDAFVFGSFDLGDMPGNFRLGRHSVLYGESLFMGANGIARAQAPIDVIKATAVPDTQFKELIRPVPQVSGTLQVSDAVSLGAYYQFRWEGDRIPAVGSYFSFADNSGAGAERLLPGALLPPAGAPQQPDQRPRNSGQEGMQLRLRAGEADIGFYAVRFHSKNFDQYTYLNAPPMVFPTGYRLTYAEGIKAFGASISQTFGDVNLAAEVSTRRNAPFVSIVGLFPDAAAIADNSGNARYAVGNSAHAQGSMIWQVPKTFLFNEATMAAEVAWNRALEVTRNPEAVDPNSKRDAWGLRTVLTPVYRQVFDGTDLELPVGLGYNPKGASRVVPLFNAPASDKGGDLSVGVNANYLDRWRFGLDYTHYFGAAGTFLNSTSTARTFKQVYADRDFVSFTARTSF